MDERFTLDSSYDRPADGPVVIAGSPLRLLRLGPAGVAVARALERGDELPAHHAALTTRLVDIGAIHPAASAPPVDPADLTVVVPARDDVPRWRAASCRTVLVDDASTAPLGATDVGGGAGDAGPGGSDVSVLRLDRNVGPGGARNAGLAEVTTRWVAFVDSDVEVDEHDLLALAGLAERWGAALVAPRVLARPSGAHPTLLDRYEAGHPPLDLGPDPARIAPTTRVSYVPAAVLVCRADAIRRIGGFDPGMRFGEDVDLVWRLVAGGERCRYVPSITARHRTRRGWSAWVLQRYRYGTSAAPLAARHPGALAPVRMSGWSALVWGALATGHPVTAVCIAGGTTVALVRKLRDVPPRTSLRLVATGHLWAGRLLAGAVVRAWWPAAVVAALVSRRARRTLAVAAAVTAASEVPRQRGHVGVAPAAALRLLDDAAYGAGVWAGVLRTGTWDAVAPAFASWPGRRVPGGAAQAGGRDATVRP